MAVMRLAFMIFHPCQCALPGRSGFIGEVVSDLIGNLQGEHRGATFATIGTIFGAYALWLLPRGSFMACRHRRSRDHGPQTTVRFITLGPARVPGRSMLGFFQQPRADLSAASVSTR